MVATNPPVDARISSRAQPCKRHLLVMKLRDLFSYSIPVPTCLGAEVMRQLLAVRQLRHSVTHTHVCRWTGRTRLKLGGAAALSLSIHGTAVVLPVFT